MSCRAHMRYASGGELEDSGSVQVLSDPRISISETDLEAYDLNLNRFLSLLETCEELSTRLREVKEMIDRVDGLIKDRKDEKAERLRTHTESTSKAWKQLQEQLFPEPVQGIRLDPSLLTSRVGELGGYFRGYWLTPSANDRAVLEQTEKAVADFSREVDRFVENEFREYRNAVKRADISVID